MRCHCGARFSCRRTPERCWCLNCATRYRPLWKRSAFTSLVVGTILVAINQGDLLLHGTWFASLVWKIPLTYAVPFCVATWGYLVNNRVRR